MILQRKLYRVHHELSNQFWGGLIGGPGRFTGPQEGAKVGEMMGLCPGCDKPHSALGKVPWDVFATDDVCGPECLALALLRWNAREVQEE